MPALSAIAFLLHGALVASSWKTIAFSLSFSRYRLPSWMDPMV